jgi:hypothetical protein
MMIHSIDSGTDPKNGASPSFHRTKRKRTTNAHFADQGPELQLQEFLAWLPPELLDAPGIDWTTLPSGVMGYLVRSVKDSVHAPYLAVAAASLMGALKGYVLRKSIGNLHTLLSTLEETCHMERIADLRQVHIWQDFAAKTPVSAARFAQFAAYAVVSGTHYPAYLERLNLEERHRMQRYALPLMPHGFVKQYGGQAALKTAAQTKRRAQSDILVPLYPVLRQLVRERSQVAERTIAAIREARRKVEAGEAELPLSFAHTDLIPFVNRDARTISEVQIQGRETTMQFTLWDKASWVLHHPDRFSARTRQHARDKLRTYRPEQNLFFVQYHGQPDNLLWFGDLVAKRLFQHFTKRHAAKERMDNYRSRWQFARDLGFSHGCCCKRPGLLAPGDPWLALHQHEEDLLFEPESLYRGVLYATTLAMISLCNGSRVSELLQVSWNRERRITRVETVKVLGEDGRPLLGPDGSAMTKQEKIHLQYLLPKGARTDEERQLFPLSKEVIRLMGELKQVLEEAHGTIPIVYPARGSTKYEDLKPEQYFFQWAASPDGRTGLLHDDDVQVLLRFILHGLELYTITGEPILVSTHLLRHVMATDARQYRNIPAEAIAHFFLHHRLRALLGRSPSASEVSNYYFSMTEAQKLAIIREDLDEQDEQDRALVLTTPTPHDLEQMNEDLRAVYEQWQCLHPTALGYCGCPGLCPRGYNRVLCIGCPFLITDPEKMGAARAWRASYAKQAELLEAQGNVNDARQVRSLMQQLDDHIAVMRLQQQAERDGTYIPLFRVIAQEARSNGGAT